MGHINIPIFIPHLGCPNQCIFCNQRFISGKIEFKESDVEQQICEVLKTIKDDKPEIAFFGGSFTGIDQNLMIRLLDIAQKFITSGKVSAIRMSTRPDYINPKIVDILKNYKISCVELGIQSMNNDVLSYLKRGHTTDDTKNAIRLLKENNIPFVGQMMIGLPTATIQDEIECAEFIARNGAQGARIYPTLVFKNTELENITSKGLYVPLTCEEAISRSATALAVFVKANIPCIRIGLCESENLHSDTTFVAGPNHPSIGELVKSELYMREICVALRENSAKSVIIMCPSGATSQVIGNKRKNISKLKEMYGFKQIKVIEDKLLKPYNIKIINKED